MKEPDKTKFILDNLDKYDPKFDDGFSDRVLEKLESLDSEENEKKDLGQFLKWITLSGVAAVIVLLLMVYFTEGSLQTDAIIGLINYSPDEPLLASLNY